MSKNNKRILSYTFSKILSKEDIKIISGGNINHNKKSITANCGTEKITGGCGGNHSDGCDTD